jgi:low molecular weight protein-tyrosine phosphatase
VPTSLNAEAIDPLPHATDAPRASDALVNILVVCTANQCRSPMAAALLDRELTRCGVPARVQSAGTNAVADIPATDDAIVVMKADGLDISTHRSRPVDTADLDRADVVVTMTRAQLRDLATRSPAAFPRVFTLKELARRAQEQPRERDEELRTWITRLGAERRTTDLLGDDPVDDVEDPIGCPVEVYAAVAGELDDAVSSVVDAGWCRGSEVV